MSIYDIVKNAPKIAVFGSDGDHCTEQAREAAYHVGKLLAQAGAVVYTGGGKGVMEAASKGAAEYGGLTVGILPGSKHEEGNPYLALSLPTGIGFARGQILTQTVDAAIIIEGGLGTHEEAAYMYWLQKPAVAIYTTGGTAAEIAGKSLDKRNLPAILSADNASSAVKMVLERVKL